MRKINLPVTEKEIRKLKLGEEVLVSGILVTARDMAHKFLTEKRPASYKKILKGVFIYHCGPIMRKTGTKWDVIAAGPTTSLREESYEDLVIKDYGIKGVIGKGGMGARTKTACRKYGAVYLDAVGGASQTLARSVERVEGVSKLKKFGVPEAMWIWRVKDFPCIVSIDAKGKSLHDSIKSGSRKRALKILKK